MTEHDVLGTVVEHTGEFGSLWQLVSTSESLQVSLGVLIAGLIIIMLAYRKFSGWIRSKKFYYFRPHLARFIMVLVLPLFAIVLISSVNTYIQVFELFSPEALRTAEVGPEVTEVFAKLLNTINIIVVGYTVAHLIPIFLIKRGKSNLEREDFEAWIVKAGFKDDDGDLFHKLYKWHPPVHAPVEIRKEEFAEKLKTEEGRAELERFHTAQGQPIGTYERLADNAFEQWKESERAKYKKYFQACISGDNESGTKLKTGKAIDEIYQIDVWREEKRLGDFEEISAGRKPAGYARRKRKNLPKSLAQILPLGIFLAVLLGVVGWWGVDLFVLATATGGFSIGLGLALQETMQNWFAYIMIRKDRIVSEGERVQLDSGYNGYVYMITPRVTYVRHALNESIAVIPTRSLINAQIINYTKDVKMVPAIVSVGVSYLNNPKGVAAILVKVGNRAMKEVMDDKGNHLVVQKQCPYRSENKASCGCDRGIVVDIDQPVVRFEAFNDSSLDFTLWVYVRDYGSQFKTETDMRMIMYEEFKRYDIRIPWPIRTVYQGDENREAEEIDRLKANRKKVVEEYGIGDIIRGGDED